MHDNYKSTADWERAFIEMLASGNPDQRKLSRLYMYCHRRYGALSRNIARRQGFPLERASELLCDALSLMYERSVEGNFRYDSGKGLGLWLSRTMKNLAMNRNKRAERFCRLERPDGTYIALSCNSTQSEIHHRLEDEGAETWVGREAFRGNLVTLARDLLSPSLYRVFCLAFLDGLDNEEGAEVMEYLNAGIFCRKKSECLRCLRDQLDPREYYRLALLAA